MIRKWFKRSELEVRGGTITGKATPDPGEEGQWVKAELVQLAGHPLPDGPEERPPSISERAQPMAVEVRYHCPHCRGELEMPGAIR